MDPIYVTAIGIRIPTPSSPPWPTPRCAMHSATGSTAPPGLGHVSDETQLVLDRFGFPAPVWIKTMRTQVRDLDYDTPPALSSGVTISRAWAALSTDTSIAALPITKEDGTLFGMLSSGDIAASDMQSIEHPHIDAVPLFNVLSVLEGRILNEAGDLVDSISGDVCIALPQSCDNLLFSGSGSIIVCGHQPDMCVAPSSSTPAASSSVRPSWTSSSAKRRRTPSSSPRRSMPTAPSACCISHCPSAASAARRTSSASISTTLSTTSARAC